MTILRRGDHTVHRYLDAELASHLRVVDRSIDAWSRGCPSPVAGADMLRALGELRGTGIVLGNKGLVAVAGALTDAIELVMTPPGIPVADAWPHLCTMAAALRALIATQADGGDPRPHLTVSWAAIQALRELRVSTAERDRWSVLTAGPDRQERSTSFRDACELHIASIRLAADQMADPAAYDEAQRAVTHSLHALMGAADVAGESDMRECCHRSEGRILELVERSPLDVEPVIAEVRLAADALEELLSLADASENTGPAGDRDDRGHDEADEARQSIIRRFRRAAAALERGFDRWARTRDAADERAVLADIDRVATILDALRRSLLDARRDPSAFISEPAPVDDLLVDLRAGFAELQRQTQTTCHLEIDAELVHLDWATAAALRDPLLHLLRNAIEHGIEPEAARRDAGKFPHGTVSLRMCQREDAVEIEVADDGAGIVPQRVIERARAMGFEVADTDDDEALQRLFLPGLTLRDVSGHSSGRGIGLDIVRAAIDELGGTIDVSSSPGKGARFRIVIPSGMHAVDWDAREQRADSAAPVESRPRTALVVDDSVGVRRVVGRALERHGWRTVQARDGAEALTVLATETPDVLITDLEMPVLDGYALLQAVRRDERWSGLPIVVMTSRVSETSHASLIDIGADVCVGKPFEGSAIVAAIEAATERRNVAQVA